RDGHVTGVQTCALPISNGAVMAFGSIVMTKLAVAGGLSPWLAIGAGVATCALFGALNGSLVTLAKLPPFIVTLGTLNIAMALTRSEERRVGKGGSVGEW